MNFFDELLSEKEEYSVPQITAPGLLNAVVKEIWDENHKGMVKVEYIMGEKDHKTSDWVRVMTPYGGKEYGNYWLPEIDTEVVVGFVNGNLNMPIVLGCLWNETDTFPKDAVNEKNETKTIMTKAGNQIIFQETQDKEIITIKTPKELEITIDDEKESISLQDKEKKNSVVLDASGGNITVTAEKGISLKVGSNEVLKADSSKVSVTADKIELGSSNSLKLNSQGAELGGSKVTVKASGSLELSASGMAKLKGSMVKIN